MLAGLQILSSGFLVTLFTENYRAIPHLGGLPDSSEVLLTCHVLHYGICPHYCTNENNLNTFWAFSFATTIADLRSLKKMEYTYY
jgi:hypothetical protein